MPDKLPIKNIPNPELLLPDDNMGRPAEMYRAISAFFGRDYPSLAAIIKARTAVEHELALRMNDTQRAIAGPAWVMYQMSGVNGARLQVFGEVQQPDVAAKLNAEDRNMTDPKQLRRLTKRIENAHMRGWLYGQWWSRTDKRGAWGCMHRSFIAATITQAVFEGIKANGWVTT